MKELSPLLKEALLVVHEKYLSKPYTDLFEQESLRHYNDLAKVEFAHGVVHRPNHKFEIYSLYC